MNPFVAVQIFPVVASGGAGASASVGAILATVTEFLTWALSSITSVVTWIIGNNLAMVYVSMFIVGFVVAYLFRILHSA